MKQKTKRIARAAFLTLAIMAMPLLIVGCQKEDLGTENPANQKIKAYEETFTLENFDDPYIKDNVTIDWNAFRSEETDSVTVYAFNTELKEKQFIENGDQRFYTLYKLLVTEDDGEANLQLLKFFTDDKENLDQVDYFNMESFSGTLYYYSLDGRNTKIVVYEDGEVISEFEDKGHGAITEQSKAPVAYCEDCPEGGYVLVITEHYTDYYVSWNGGDFTYSYSVYTGTTSEWVWVPGTGGSGGGGSINPTSHSHYDYPHGPSAGTNNHPNENVVDEELVSPPSCESFNFSNTTSNWQEAAVKDIRFRVVVLSPQGNYINFDIWYNTPILFGMPRNMVIGGNISSGLAAELSAQALKVSMDETVAQFGNQPTTELQVRLYFEQRLKHNYPIITNGGRVNFNPTFMPVVPTEYETNFFGTGNCD